MSFGLSDIRKVMEAFDESDWDQINLSTDDLQLHLVARGAANTVENVEHPRPQAKPSATAAAATPASVPTAAARPDETDQDKSAGQSDSEPLGDGLTIASPSVGCFYRSPRPGTPPFVEVGDEVSSGTTVCIVEVMKLMNPVQVDITGVVAAIHADNGENVDKGQPLFTIIEK